MKEKHAGTVRAVSIYYGHALAILRGEKTVEYRSTNLSLGDIVICTCAKDLQASWQEYGYTAPTSRDLGVTLCLVTVTASINGDWHLANVRPLERHSIKGAQGIWRLDASKVVELDQQAKPSQIAPKRATSAPLTPLVKALLEVPKKSKTPAQDLALDRALVAALAKDNAALDLVARCRALRSTLEIENIVTEARKATVQAAKKLGLKW